jgi:hypothetical protein
VLHVVQRVGHQQQRLPLQMLAEGLEEEEGAHLRVHCAQHVVQQQHLRLRVQRSRQRHPRPLTPRKSAPALPNQCLVPCTQDLKVGLETGEVHCGCIARRVKCSAEEDVSANCVTDNPRLLTDVGDPAVEGHCRPAAVAHFSEERVEEGSFAASELADDTDELALSDAQLNPP